MIANPTPIRILIADDHENLRSSVRGILEGTEDFQVIAEAEDGHQALELSAALQPDVVILDINMPTLDGLQTAQRLQSDVPNTRVLFLSMYADKRFVKRAAELGVSGYLLKDRALSQLAEAVRTASQGGRYLSPEIRHVLAELHCEEP